jgi:hypothetical protein
MEALLQGDAGASPTNFQSVILTLLLALLIGQLIAWIYILTHAGESYSRSFVVSLIAMPVIIALVLMVLSNNFVTAFGLMAVFAVVRFRNVVRDTLDTCYVLAVLVLGMACGTQKYSTAVVGALILAGVMVYLWLSSFGSRPRYDLVVNLQWTRQLTELTVLERLLARHSFEAHCANRHVEAEAIGAALTYRLLMRDPDRVAEMIREIESLPGVERVSSLKHENESES